MWCKNNQKSIRCNFELGRYCFYYTYSSAITACNFSRRMDVCFPFPLFKREGHSFVPWKKHPSTIIGSLIAYRTLHSSPVNNCSHWAPQYYIHIMWFVICKVLMGQPYVVTSSDKCNDAIFRSNDMANHQLVILQIVNVKFNPNCAIVSAFRAYKQRSIYYSQRLMFSLNPTN